MIPGDHPLATDCVAAYELWQDTDVLLGIGSRLELQYMRWTGMQRLVHRPDAPPHLIRIDIDAAEMRRLRPHTGIVADAKAGTQALVAALQRHTIQPASPARIEDARTKTAAAISAIQPQMDYLNVIRDVLPRDGFFVDDLCQVAYAAYFGWKSYHPRSYITCGYQGTLGYGYPTALGVKAANPDRAVVSILGDGGFMFAVQELATAVQENLGVIALVFNNNAYGNVMRDQKRLFGNRVIATELQNPDFVRLAECFGATGIRVDSPAALRPALSAAIQANKPAVIEVTVDIADEASPWDLLIRQPGA